MSTRHRAVASLVFVRAMISARCSLAFLILLAGVTSGCAAGLPPSAESLLLRRLDARRLINVHEVQHKSVNGFDFLGVFATFETDWSFEQWYHPRIVLRKKRSDPDWSQAELFHSRKGVIDPFALSDAEFQ